MLKRTLILIALAFIIPVSTAEASERLLFEQGGLSDGSIMPFSIQAGPLENTTRDVFFVTSETYRDLSAQVAKASKISPPTPQSLFFQVRALQDARCQKLYTISPDDFIRVVGHLRTAYDAAKYPVPAFLVELDNKEFFADRAWPADAPVQTGSRACGPEGTGTDPDYTLKLEGFANPTGGGWITESPPAAQ